MVALSSRACTACTDTFDASGCLRSPHLRVRSGQWLHNVVSRFCGGNPNEQRRFAPEGRLLLVPKSLGAYLLRVIGLVLSREWGNGNYSNSDGYYFFKDQVATVFGSSDMGLFRCSHGAGAACKVWYALEGQGPCVEPALKAREEDLGLCVECSSLAWNLFGVAMQLSTPAQGALETDGTEQVTKQWKPPSGIVDEGFLIEVNAISDFSKPKTMFSIVLKQIFNYMQHLN
ncbi:hypothetical protein AK812_SmicGene24824 [Symbiodinium microadriaticum]|uniref:Uncharacterized protein n=1 Tax=Symbiodinium microadriaticum TaxID=2951 RepID=A0A1Q9DDZ4_SYMMI|nr:hypothetical protein AK812_SmicGene24824 [Symbiodinium microadriaticum]